MSLGKIRILILWAQWILFSRRSVILIDDSGMMSARLVFGYKNFLWAKRYGMGIKHVILLRNGKLQNASYVNRWEPLFPHNFTVDRDA